MVSMLSQEAWEKFPHKRWMSRDVFDALFHRFYLDLAKGSSVAPPAVKQSLGWTLFWPRPEAKHFGDATVESAIARQQEEWDQAHVSIQNYLDGLRENQEARKQQADQAAADEESRRQQEAEQVKQELREAFLSIPGASEDDFEAQYPSLLAQYQQQAFEAAEQAPHQAFTRLIRANL